MSRRRPGIKETLIVRYINYLKEQERSAATLKSMRTTCGRSAPIYRTGR